MRSRLYQGYFFTPLLKPFLKLSAYFVLPIFVVTSIVSSPLMFAAGSLPDLKLNAVPTMVRELPAEKGRVTHWQWNTHSKSPYVIHIQDAHANVSAQENIRQILHWLDAECQKQGVSMSIAIEGALGEIHPEYFDLIPGELSVGEEAVKKLAAQGELSGADLFAWDRYVAKIRKTSFGKMDAKVYGAETPELYADNLASFRKLLYEQAEIETRLVPVRAALERKSSRVLSPALRTFLKERRLRKLGDYGNGIETAQWEAWLPYLAKMAKETLSIDLSNRFEQIRFPQMTRVLTLQQMEVLSAEEIKEAEQQKKTVLLRLKKIAVTPETRGLVEDFQSLEKSLNPRATTEALWQFSQQYHVALQDFPQFWNQTARVILRAEIDMEMLAQEMDPIEQAITDQLAETAAEKDVVKAYAQLALLEDLLKLELPRHRHDLLKTHPLLTQSLVTANLLQQKAAGKLEAYVQAASQFYEGALKRDQTLVAQALEGAHPESLVVLISGGFHTEGIEALLHSQNMNFAVIQPVIESSDHGEAYHRVLKEENADLSSYLEGSTLNKQEAIFMKAYLETAVPALAEDGGLTEKLIAEKVAAAMNTHPVLKKSLSITAVWRDESAHLSLTAQSPRPDINANKLVQAVAASDLMQTPDKFDASWRRHNRDLLSSQRGYWGIDLRSLGLGGRLAAHGVVENGQGLGAWRMSQAVPDDAGGIRDSRLLRSEVRTYPDFETFRAAVITKAKELKRPIGLILPNDLVFRQGKLKDLRELLIDPETDIVIQLQVSSDADSQHQAIQIFNTSLPENKHLLTSDFNLEANSLKRVRDNLYVIYVTVGTPPQMVRHFSDEVMVLEKQNVPAVAGRVAISETRHGAGIEALETLRQFLNNSLQYGWWDAASRGPDSEASMRKILLALDPEQQTLPDDLPGFFAAWIGNGGRSRSEDQIAELQPRLEQLNQAILQLGLHSQFEPVRPIPTRNLYQFDLVPQIRVMTAEEAATVLTEAVGLIEKSGDRQGRHVMNTLSSVSSGMLTVGADRLRFLWDSLDEQGSPQTAAQWRDWIKDPYAITYFFRAFKWLQAKLEIHVEPESIFLDRLERGQDGSLTATFFPRNDGMRFPKLLEMALWLTGREWKEVLSVRLRGSESDGRPTRIFWRDAQSLKLDLSSLNALSFKKSQGIQISFLRSEARQQAQQASRMLVPSTARSEARRQAQQASRMLVPSTARSEVRISPETSQILMAGAGVMLAAGFVVAHAFLKRRQREQLIPNLRKIIGQSGENLVGLLIAPDSKIPGEYKYMRILQHKISGILNTPEILEFYKLPERLRRISLIAKGDDFMPLVLDGREPGQDDPYYGLDLLVAMNLMTAAEFGVPIAFGMDLKKPIYEHWRVVTRDAETDEWVTAQLNASMERVRNRLGRSEMRLSGADFVALDKVATDRLIVTDVHNLSGVKDEADKMARLALLNPVGILIRSNTKVTDDFLNQLKDAVEAKGQSFRLKHIIRLGHGLDNVTFDRSQFPDIEVRGTKGSAPSIAALALRMTALAEARWKDRTAVEQDQAPSESFLPRESFRSASAEKIKKRTEDERAVLQAKSDEMLVRISREGIDSLRGQVVGVIGAGNIGHELIKQYRELGLRVWVNSRTMEQDTSSRPAEKNVRFAEKNEIYQSANFVVVLTGLNAATKGMIGDRAIELMSKNTDLKAVINPDRGKIVDETAMARLLGREDNRVLYLLDDVPETDALRQLAIYTDHIGGTTQEAEESIRAIIEGILLELIQRSKFEDLASDESLLKLAEVEVDGYLKGLMTRGAIGEEAYTKDREHTLANLRGWLGDAEIDRLSPMAKDSVREAIKTGRWADLIEAFRQQVSFGTAGIRGMSAYSQEELEMIAREGVTAQVLKGPNTINDVVLLKTTAGLIRYMQEEGEHKIVIGYDSRVAGTEFAELIAKAFAGASTSEHPFEIALFDEASPFPELSFAVTVQRADKGILISASHNPSNYNGFKITDRTGAQLTGSLRDAIVEAMGQASLSEITLRSLAEVPAGVFTWLGGSAPLPGKDYQGHAALVDMHSLHAEQVKHFIIDTEMLQENAPKVNVGFAAFNGAGNKAVPRLLAELGFTNTKVVESLQELNGLFPAFGWGEQPDPGDPIAADIAVKAFIAEHGQHAFDELDLLIGTDPDADRAGIIVKVPEEQQAKFGKYKLLSANDAWTLLLWYRFQREAELQGTDSVDRSKQYLTFSHVTTDALEAVGKHFGIVSRGDLPNKQGQPAGGYLEGRRSWVGFSYIAAFADKMRRQGFTNVGGAEESNGFSILGGPVLPGEVLGAQGHVNDKDGTFAAVLLAEAATYAKSNQTTLFEMLDVIYGQIGYYATANKPLPRVGAFFGSSGKEKKIRLLKTAQDWLAVANDKTKPPFKIAGREVIGAVQWQSGRYDGAHYEGFPDEGVRFFFQDSALKSDDDFTLSRNYITIRPSGTSQTLRFYTQLLTDIKGASDIAELKSSREKEALEIALVAQRELLNAAGYGEGDVDYASVQQQIVASAVFSPLSRSEIRQLLLEQVVLAGPLALGFQLGKVRSEVRSFEEGTELVEQAEKWLAEKKFDESAAAFTRAKTLLTPIAEAGGIAQQKRMAARMIAAIQRHLNLLEDLPAALPAAILAGFGYTALTDEGQAVFFESALNEMGVTGITAQSSVLAQAERFAEILESRVTLSLEDNPDLKMIALLGLREPEPKAVYNDKTIHAWRAELANLAAQPFASIAIKPTTPPVITAPTAMGFLEAVSDIETPSVSRARIVLEGKVSILQIPTAVEIYQALYGSDSSNAKQLPLEVFQAMWARVAELARSRQKITAAALTDVNAQARRRRFQEGLQAIEVQIDDGHRSFSEDDFVRMLKYTEAADSENTSSFELDRDRELAQDLWDAYALTIKGNRSPNERMLEQFYENIQAYRTAMRMSPVTGLAQVETQDLVVEWPGPVDTVGKAAPRRQRFRKAIGALGLTETEFIQRLWRGGSPAEPVRVARPTVEALLPASNPQADAHQRWAALAEQVLANHHTRVSQRRLTEDVTPMMVDVKREKVDLRQVAIELQRWFDREKPWFTLEKRRVHVNFTLDAEQFLDLLLTYRDFRELAPTSNIPHRYLKAVLAEVVGLRDSPSWENISDVFSKALYRVKDWRRDDFAAGLFEQKPEIFDLPDYNVVGQRFPRKGSATAPASSPAVSGVSAADYPSSERPANLIGRNAAILWEETHGEAGKPLAAVGTAEGRLSAIATQVAEWLLKQTSQDIRDLTTRYGLNKQTLFAIFAFYRAAYYSTQLGIVPRTNMLMRAIHIADPNIEEIFPVPAGFVRTRDLIAEALRQVVVELKDAAEPFSYLVSYQMSEYQQPSYVLQPNGLKLLVAQVPQTEVRRYFAQAEDFNEVGPVLNIYVSHLRKQGIPPAPALFQSLLGLDDAGWRDRLSQVNTFLTKAGFEELFLLSSEPSVLSGQIVRALAELTETHKQPVATLELSPLAGTEAFRNTVFEQSQVSQELTSQDLLWAQLSEWLTKRYPDRNVAEVLAKVRAAALIPQPAEKKPPMPPAVKASAERAKPATPAAVTTAKLPTPRQAAPAAVSVKATDGEPTSVVLARRILNVLVLSSTGQLPEDRVAFAAILSAFTSLGTFTEADVQSALGSDNDTVWEELLMSEKVTNLDAQESKKLSNLLKALREEAVEHQADKDALAVGVRTVVLPETPSDVTPSQALEVPEFELLTPQGVPDNFGYVSLTVRLKADMSLDVFWQALMRIRDRVKLHDRITAIDRVTRKGVIRRSRGGKGPFDLNVQLFAGEELVVNALSRSEAREQKTDLSASRIFVEQMRSKTLGADRRGHLAASQRAVAQRSQGFYAAPAIAAREQGVSWEDAALAIFRVIAEEEGFVLDETKILAALEAAREALGEFSPLLDSTGESYQLADVVSSEQLNQSELVYALAVHILARPGDRLRLYTTGPEGAQSIEGAGKRLEKVLQKVGVAAGYGPSRITFIDASDWDETRLLREVRRALGGKQSGLRGALLSSKIEILNTMIGSGIFGLQRQTRNTNAARLLSPTILAESLDEHTIHQIEAWLASKGMSQRLAERFTAMIVAVRALAEAA